MKKLMNKGLKKMNNIAKKVAEDSPETLSVFIFYEPKMPESLKRLEGKR
ncbi:MAG: cyclic lactone autoinducer peptide [Tissierella sp.]|nr:cyclic lactone autoinducer peptide [Tissierella sp.]